MHFLAMKMRWEFRVNRRALMMGAAGFCLGYCRCGAIAAQPADGSPYVLSCLFDVSPALLRSSIVDSRGVHGHSSVEQSLRFVGQMFGVAPKLRFIGSARFDSGAFAEWSSGEPSTGTIYFGSSLFKQIEDTYHDFMPVVDAIMAHECWHLVQNRYRFVLKPPYRELQADFAAGYVVGRRRLSGEFFIESPADWIGEGQGDGAESGDHGTATQRKASIDAGFQVGFFEPEKAPAALHARFRQIMRSQ
jgi:hypothetical protein